MILPDVNLLVYAYNEDAALHPGARRWWEDLLSDGARVGLAWSVCCGYVRIMTHPAVFINPLAPRVAVSHVRSWLAEPNVEIVQAGPRHLDLLDSLLHAIGTAGNLVTDAHIAALAIEHQGEVHSTDADFARFPGLRWRNPL